MPRSKLDLLSYMLEAAKNGTTKEHIASQTNAHPRLVDDSLSMLKGLNLLIERHNSPVSFVTTEKGHKFLHDYAKLRQQLRADDLR